MRISEYQITKLKDQELLNRMTRLRSAMHGIAFGGPLDLQSDYYLEFREIYFEVLRRKLLPTYIRGITYEQI